jgi:hypothetical protein
MEDQNMGEDKKSTERPRGAYALSMFKLPFHNYGPFPFRNYGPLLHYNFGFNWYHHLINLMSLKSQVCNLGLTDTTIWSPT